METVFAFTAVPSSQTSIAVSIPHGVDEHLDALFRDAESRLADTVWTVDGFAGLEADGRVCLDVSAWFHDGDDGAFTPDLESDASLDAQAENFALDQLSRALAGAFTVSKITVNEQ